MRYIALLRGVNVGGRLVKMDRLRALFAELGYEHVRTYIQTGNVFFDTPERDRDALSVAIASHLQAALDFEVPVCLRTVAEVEQALALNPFADRTVTDDMRLNIVFASKPIPQTLELPIWSPKRDLEVAHITTMDAYVVWYIVNGRPPAVPATYLDKLLGSPVTSRYLHTTAKLLEAAKAG